MGTQQHAKNDALWILYFIILLKSGHTKNNSARPKALQKISELLRKLPARTPQCESHSQNHAQFVLNGLPPYPQVAAWPWAMFSEVLMLPVQDHKSLLTGVPLCGSVVTETETPGL